MAQITINLSQKEIDSLAEAGITDIEAYMKGKANVEIGAKADKKWNKLTPAEKEALLP